MINLVVTAIVTVGLALIRGTVWIVGLLLKIITTTVRIVLSVLPVSGAVLLLTGVYLIWFSFTGVDPLPAELPYHPDGMPFLTSFGSLILLLGDLRRSFPGFVSILILIAAVILCVPVLLVLLLSHALIALLPVLPILAAADLAVFVIYGIISRKSPFTQIRDRYFFLFPKRADRHYERTYHAWLKRHAGEFEDDTFGAEQIRGEGYPQPEEDNPRRGGGRGRQKRLTGQERRRRRIEDYYEEYDEPYDEPCDEAYDEPEEEEYVEDRHDRRSRTDNRRSSRSGFFDYGAENDDVYEDDDYEEEAFSRKQSGRQRGRREPEPPPASNTSFDFFAGCRDLAGVEKKYRSLVKIYHPDNQDGDTTAIQEINAQYTRAKKRFAP